MNNKYWKTLKKNLIIISSITGIIIPVICFYLLPDINILLDPLSKFGIAKETSFIWTIFIQITAVLLYLSNLRHIDKYHITKVQSKILEILNIISSISLSLTGIITMDVKYIHLGSATIFFLSYTGLIFWWGVFNIKYNLKIATISILTAILIILSSLSTIKFGYGLFEITFIGLIIFWNLKISLKK